MMKADPNSEASLNVDKFCKILKESEVKFPQAYDATVLKDKSILITGGASGLGAAFTKRFLESGAYVTFADFNQEGGQRFEEELKKYGFGSRAQFVRCDVTSWESQLKTFKQAMSFSPNRTLDHVIPCAGVGGNIFQLDTSDVAKNSNDEPAQPNHSCIDISLIGSLYSLRLAIFYMGCAASEKQETSGTKSIMMVGSLSGYNGIPLSADYTASKYGVRGLFKSLRYDLSSRGIRLNMIAPGYIKTPMTESSASTLQAAGVQFAEMETAVEAVMTLVCGEKINGRSICVGAGGNFDLRDDIEGLHGGEELINYVRCGFTPTHLKTSGKL